RPGRLRGQPAGAGLASAKSQWAVRQWVEDVGAGGPHGWVAAGRCGRVGAAGGGGARGGGGLRGSGGGGRGPVVVASLLLVAVVLGAAEASGAQERQPRTWNTELVGQLAPPQDG